METNQKYFTIAEISRKLSIPESTLRYRAKMFKDFLPIIGNGRKKRFAHDCLERFSFIDTLFNKGLITDDIKLQLEEKYDKEIEPEISEKSTSKETIQKSTKSPVKHQKTKEINFELNELLVPMIKIIENQESIITELRTQNKLLQAPQQKKGFFRRLFG